MPVCVYVTEREREEEGGLLRLKVDDGQLFAPHFFFVQNVSNVYSNIPPPPSSSSSPSSHLTITFF